MFEGRINRKQFWLRVLMLFMASLFAFVIPIIFEAISVSTSDVLGLISGLFYMAGMLCFLWGIPVVSVKRFQDRDKSGGWALIWFVPLLGWVWILIECGFLKGTAGDNKYGVSTLKSS